MKATTFPIEEDKGRCEWQERPVPDAAEI